VGEGLLSLIPCLIKQSRAGGCGGVGVAGWNASAAGSDGFSLGLLSSLCVGRGVVGTGLGTLLGPEETPACRVFFGPLLAVVV
jgi:hypothetical protein